MTRKQVAVVVDAFSAATQLVPEIRSRQIECIHVTSGAAPPESIFPPLASECFLTEIQHTGDEKDTAELLRRFYPSCVFPGHERSVQLVDALAAQLGVAGNDPESSALRRDKYEMALAASRRGLRIPRQIKTRHPKRALAWMRREGLNRAVVKPRNSSGTDQVVFCRSEAEAGDAVAQLVGNQNHLGFVNEEVLVQEQILGEEYVINTVSYQGMHRVTDVWWYHKRAVDHRHVIYDTDELLSATDPMALTVTAFALELLEALGIHQGPAHTEVMVDAEGPVLMECGARVDGCVFATMSRACLGVGQIELTCDAYLASDNFVAQWARSYERKKNASYVMLIAQQDATVRSLEPLARIRELPSCIDLWLRVDKNLHVRKTIDYMTCPGVAVLVHEDREIIRRDYDSIRKLEQEGFLTPKG